MASFGNYFSYQIFLIRIGVTFSAASHAILETERISRKRLVLSDKALTPRA
jgi:hypothetical protein